MCTVCNSASSLISPSRSFFILLHIISAGVLTYDTYTSFVRFKFNTIYYYHHMRILVRYRLTQYTKSKLIDSKSNWKIKSIGSRLNTSAYIVVTAVMGIEECYKVQTRVSIYRVHVSKCSDGISPATRIYLRVQCPDVWEFLWDRGMPWVWVFVICSTKHLEKCRLECSCLQHYMRYTWNALHRRMRSVRR